MTTSRAQNFTEYSRAWLLALFLTFAALGLFSTSAYAHGGYQHVMGTVQSVGADVISVKQTNGRTMDVRLDAKTTFTRGSEVLQRNDVKTGDRVVIEASKHDSYLVAHQVKLGAAAPKATSTLHSKR